mmetsp:Transcript_32072/g.70238  ORF Transcript_32072/g.70238 Transcript_32072/m.70238 type:complete len:201 (-) Transcript_32072:333-935(-)
MHSLPVSMPPTLLHMSLCSSQSCSSSLRPLAPQNCFVATRSVREKTSEHVAIEEKGGIAGGGGSGDGCGNAGGGGGGGREEGGNGGGEIAQRYSSPIWQVVSPCSATNVQSRPVSMPSMVRHSSLWLSQSPLFWLRCCLVLQNSPCEKTSVRDRTVLQTVDGSNGGSEGGDGGDGDGEGGGSEGGGIEGGGAVGGGGILQ